jgi:type VI secretion system secreted protein VgrG
MSTGSNAVTATTQEERLLRLDTPIGDNVLLVEHCTGLETVSGLFSFELDLLLDTQKHRASEVTPGGLLGRKVVLALALNTGERFFNGIVKRLAQGDRDERFQHYRMEVVPWSWLLTLKSDCRIFQGLSVPEIVKKLFDELKGDYSDLVSYRDALTKQYVQRDYCVQYRETGFNFISRLLEQEGIFYFFEHSQHGHTLVLADANSAFAAAPDNGGKFRFLSEGGYEERHDTVTSISRQHELRPGKWELRDYHFEMPSKSLEKTETTTINVANNPKLGLYDFPGDYAALFNKPGSRLGNVEPTGEAFARVRMQEEEAGYDVLTGSSTVRAFSSGYAFELTDHRDMAGKYTLVSVQHSMAQSPSYVSGGATGAPYHNGFVCIPNSIPFRPRRLTPKPVVQGPQTAVVTVKSGEESWLDKYGRVRVQFHWDRLGKNDEESACWMRVAQSWAGSNWGSHFWPRVGQEVVVEFLEGDPDQPLVTGSVYNASQMPPYELPKYYTRSGVMSRSSKQGSSSNYNEVRLEDKKGDEQLFLHAEKDMDVRVKHDSREFVANDRHLIVKQSQFEEVDGEKHQKVKADMHEEIGGTMSLKIQGARNEMVTGTDSHAYGGDRSEKVSGDLSLQVGGNRNEKVGSVFVVESGQEIHFKAGMKLIIEAGMQVTLKGAGGFVDIGPAGVTIQGTMVKINSGGAAGSGTAANPKDPAPPVEPKAPDEADDGSKGGKMN